MAVSQPSRSSTTRTLTEAPQGVTARPGCRVGLSLGRVGMSTLRLMQPKATRARLGAAEAPEAAAPHQFGQLFAPGLRAEVVD